jgi:hypothetical protein
VNRRALWCSRTCAYASKGACVATPPEQLALHGARWCMWCRSNPLHLFLAHGHSNATLGHDLDHHHGVCLCLRACMCKRVTCTLTLSHTRHAQCVKRQLLSTTPSRGALLHACPCPSRLLPSSRSPRLQISLQGLRDTGRCLAAAEL